MSLIYVVSYIKASHKTRHKNVRMVLHVIVYSDMQQGILFKKR